MLKLRVRAQLGNQMFQYAAMRTIAERRGLCLAWEEGLSLPDWLRRRLGRKTMTRPVDIPKYFTIDGDSRLRNCAHRTIWRWRYGTRPNQYTSRYMEIAPGFHTEAFDPDIETIAEGTEIVAWLQSPRYFAGNEDAVRRWFRLRPRWQRRVDQLEKQLPSTPDGRCGIHVRRTDFAFADPGDPVNGWMLPLSYYQDAVASLPKDLLYVIVSDAPDWVEQHFGFLGHRFVSRGESGAVDMALLGRCRFNIIANSTFSWWGAWLNTQQDKVVICPEFFNGWKYRRWVPDEIRVDGWTYLPVRAPVPSPQTAATP